MEHDEPLLDEEEEWAPLGEEEEPGSRAALFSSQAARYARFRPSYPDHVYARIYRFAAEGLSGGEGGVPPPQCRQLALDIGCGPGKVAADLARTFQQVIGIDPSKDQLYHAEQLPNLSYLAVAAELISQHLPPASVDLIAMAETLHWINHVDFYEQARQVLKPTGTLAIWGYDLCRFLPLAGGPLQQHDPGTLKEANALMWSFTYELMGPFWDERRGHIDNHYALLQPRPSQFATVVQEEGDMEKITSLNNFLGFVSSWSPYAAYRTTFPRKEDPLIPLHAGLRRLLGIKDDAAPQMRVSWPLFFLLCRRPVPPG